MVVAPSAQHTRDTLQMPLSPFAEYANNGGGAALAEAAWGGNDPTSLPSLSMYVLHRAWPLVP